MSKKSNEIKQKKIGVYICHCGGNISDYVDVAVVEKAVQDDPGVHLVKRTMFTCSDSSQVDMTNDIKDNKLDGMVVASCSPKLHLSTFRDVAVRGGLNPYNYIQVNLREQCSWAHSDKTNEATEKAIKLLKAGIEKARRIEDLTPIEIETINSSLIIGAGVSGMRAAIELADLGTDVYLIEKDHFVGGRVAQWGDVYQGDTRGDAIVERLYKEVRKRDNITFFTGTELIASKGSVGNFDLTIRINPRYVKGKCTEREFEKMEKVCPISVPDEFNFGLTERKAIYKRGEKALPPQAAIDMEACNKCGECASICKENIILEQKPETINLKVGAILTNTGFDPYEPADGEFGYKEHEEVITLPQFNRLMELSNGEFNYKGKAIRTVAFVYCVGSRETEGARTYCSRICCTSAIHAGLIVKNKFPNVKSFHLHKGIRTYGKQEILYDQASREGNVFLQFEDDDPPVVEKLNGTLSIKINDMLTEGEELELNPDMIVLVTGLVAREGKQLQSILKIPVGGDNFFNEVHPKLRPVETVMDGIYIGGTCQGPRNITETMMSTLAATAKASSLISKGTIQLEPTLALVYKDQCEWCGKCEEICTYGAVLKVDYDGKSVAEINTAMCKGCGACMPVCEVDAIDLLGYSNYEIYSMIDAFTADVNLAEFKQEGEKKVEEEEVKTEDSNQRFEVLPDLGKKIIRSLEGSPKTIPEIAEEIVKSTEEVTYYLMSLRKYGYIAETDELNDDDYYVYELKN